MLKSNYKQHALKMKEGGGINNYKSKEGILDTFQSIQALEIDFTFLRIRLFFKHKDWKKFNSSSLKSFLDYFLIC